MVRKSLNQFLANIITDKDLETEILSFAEDTKKKGYLEPNKTFDIMSKMTSYLKANVEKLKKEESEFSEENLGKLGDQIIAIYKDKMKNKELDEKQLAEFRKQLNFHLIAMGFGTMEEDGSDMKPENFYALLEEYKKLN